MVHLLNLAQEQDEQKKNEIGRNISPVYVMMQKLQFQKARKSIPIDWQ